MTASVHKNSTMAKSTETSSITSNNPAQLLDYLKILDTSNVIIVKVLVTSDQNLQSNTINSENSPKDDDTTIDLSDGDSDNDCIESVATKST